MFVQGCFWHRCPTCAPNIPVANREFWVNKFLANAARDDRSRDELERIGWRRVDVWEHEVRPDPVPRAVELASEILRSSVSTRSLNLPVVTAARIGPSELESVQTGHG